MTRSPRHSLARRGELATPVAARMFEEKRGFLQVTSGYPWNVGLQTGVITIREAETIWREQGGWFDAR